MNITRVSILVVFAALVFPSAVVAEGPELEECLVLLIDDVEISAQESGILTAVPVVEGQDVEPGDLLAQINDSQPRMQKIAAEAELAAVQKTASDDIEVRYSRAALEVAEAEYDQAIALNQRIPNSVPFAELRRLELTVKRSELEIDRRQLEFEVAGLTAQANQAAVDSAQAAIDRRRVEATLAGMVVSVYREAGEWVQAGDPVVRLVRLDRLRVQGRLDGDEYDPATIDGRPVTVQFTLADERVEELPGKVVFVSPLILSGNIYQVRAEVDNSLIDEHWLLKPGMTATMNISLD